MNAKFELLEDVKEEDIVCAHVIYNESWDGEHKEFVLKEKYTKEDLNSFLSSLDFYYDNGFGTQYISGVVLLKNNEWLERAVYDGREWWSKKVYPNTPEVCR